MKIALSTLAMTLFVGTASAQSFAATSEYRVCPPAQTQQGVEVVKEICGELHRPTMAGIEFTSLGELQIAQSRRETFRSDAAGYSQCVTDFIDSFRRPGAPADSDAPDRAACAHAWAQDESTKLVREFGRACVAFSDRSMYDSAIEPWSGDCYPSANSGTRHG